MASEENKLDFEKNQNRKVVEEIFNQILLPKYGSITIIIHDGKVVQIEKLEKFRL
jgi:hypothetical protein